MHTSLDLPCSCKFMSSQTSTTVSQHLHIPPQTRFLFCMIVHQGRELLKNLEKKKITGSDVSMLPWLHSRQDTAKCERIWTDHGNILISTLSDDPFAIAHCNQAIPVQTCWHHHLLEKSRSWNTTWQTNTHWNKLQYLAEDSETAQTRIKQYVAKVIRLKKSYMHFIYITHAN
jgi:hypothetical protein